MGDFCWFTGPGLCGKLGFDLPVIEIFVLALVSGLVTWATIYFSVQQARKQTDRSLEHSTLLAERALKSARQDAQRALDAARNDAARALAAAREDAERSLAHAKQETDRALKDALTRELRAAVTTLGHEARADFEAKAVLAFRSAAAQSALMSIKFSRLPNAADVATWALSYATYSCNLAAGRIKPKMVKEAERREAITLELVGPVSGLMRTALGWVNDPESVNVSFAEEAARYNKRNRQVERDFFAEVRQNMGATSAKPSTDGPGNRPLRT